MSATLSHPVVPGPPGSVPLRTLRFGAEFAAGPGDPLAPSAPSAYWLLKRNCSITPRQTMAFYASLCALSLAIAAFCWVQGAALVMPFAALEVTLVGGALLLFARHATDHETIQLQPGRLTVEHVLGRRVERCEFAPAWVRVEPAHGAGSLIEISGQGQRIAVGRFVRPELRRQLADELRWALRRWQGFAGRAAVTAAAAATATAHHDPTQH